MTTMAGQDFVHVQLTPAGVAMAGKGGKLGIVRGRVDLSFKVGEAQRVTLAYDWNAVLSSARDRKGNLLFEIAPDAPAPAAATTTGAATAPVSLPVRPASSPAHDATPVNHPGAVEPQSKPGPVAVPEKAGG